MVTVCDMYLLYVTNAVRTLHMVTRDIVTVT